MAVFVLCSAVQCCAVQCSAVQCKFYATSQYIGREDVDPFLVAAARRPFTARLFVSSIERSGKNAEKVLADQMVPVQRIGVAELGASPFDCL
ncbi:MAG: restriction endonuclease [Acidimicrobiales bacterium]